MVHTAPLIVLNLKSFDANKYDLVQQLVSAGTTSKTRGKFPQIFSGNVNSSVHTTKWTNVADSLICNKE